MNKNLLIRHINGETTLQESESVILWINKSADNETYYINLMNLIVLENVSREHPLGVGMSNELKEDSLKRIQNKIDNKQHKPVINIWKLASYAAIALLFISIAFNLYQFGGKDKVLVINKIPAVSNIINTYYTENGVKGKLMLPDSSFVWLNSGSKISYPKEFDSDKRRISFEGEGYFDVVKNPQWPMEVITPKGMRVEVLGTKFHIKSYDNDDEEQATLFSGIIDISKTDGTKNVLNMKVLKPRESLRFTSKGAVVLTPRADTTKKIAWKRGELLFEQTPMQEVIKMLERWHGVEIIVKDPVVLSYKFTADFSSESIVQILELFRYTSPIDYTIEENKIYLKKRKI
ncbi:MAG: DUF4974 domain-containing protein [Bacteroidales bacterium]